VKKLFKLFVSGLAMVTVATALATVAVGQDLDRPEVKFEATLVECDPPPLYDINLSINGQGPKPIVTVEAINKNMSAEWRAQQIKDRLQQAWDALGSISKFQSTYDVVKNMKYGVFVIGTNQTAPELPAHIMQADALVYLSEGETPYRSLRITLEELQNYLKNQDPNTKAPEDRQLNDQKAIARQKYIRAMRNPANRIVDLEQALTYNPEYPAAYMRLIKALRGAGQTAKAKQVENAYGLLKKALPHRLKGDDAWDAGKYEEALQHYKQASSAFPACITYPWLQSLVLQKLGRNAEADKVWNQAREGLTTSKAFNNVNTLAHWTGMTPKLEDVTK